jgi:Co/Zn/Cd efflux system component
MAILDISEINGEQRRRLTLTGAAAGGTFVFLLVTGALAGSQALIADGLDFAALALSTGLALALKDAPAAMRAGARLVSAGVLGLIGLAVALATLHGFAARVMPEPTLMGAAALVALAANGTTLYLLRGEREGDGVLRELWFAARTDLAGSAAVLIAAGVVALVANAVPDLTVAGVIVVLFFVTLVPELRAAMAQWESQRAGPAGTAPVDPDAQ